MSAFAHPSAPTAEELVSRLSQFMAAAADQRDVALRAWVRSCDGYGRYLAALAAATGPQDIIAAHREWMNDALKALAGDVGAFLRRPMALIDHLKPILAQDASGLGRRPRRR